MVKLGGEVENRKKIFKRKLCRQSFFTKTKIRSAFLNSTF